MSDDLEKQPEQEEGAEGLTDELAKKYDPERMLRMVSRSAGRGEALDYSIRQKYEKRFGVDLGHVRVYTGEFAEEFNRKRDAYATTIGSTGMIMMGNSPDKGLGSNAHRALLAHEVTHVAQQSKGLHHKGTFSGAMVFTEEEEYMAEQIEYEEMHGAILDGQGFKLKNELDQKYELSKEKALERVKERVMEMTTDAARTQQMRNGNSRRP